MSYKPHPLRIQRKRTKGSRLPAGAVCVTRPGKFGNPFESALAFGRWLLTGEISLSQLRDTSFFPWTPERRDILAAKRDWILENMASLKGQQVACFCGLDKPCHADMLAAIANEGAVEATKILMEIRRHTDE